MFYFYNPEYKGIQSSFKPLHTRGYWNNTLLEDHIYIDGEFREKFPHEKEGAVYGILSKQEYSSWSADIPEKVTGDVPKQLDIKWDNGWYTTYKEINKYLEDETNKQYEVMLGKAYEVLSKLAIVDKCKVEGIMYTKDNIDEIKEKIREAENFLIQGSRSTPTDLYTEIREEDK